MFIYADLYTTVAVRFTIGSLFIFSIDAYTYLLHMMVFGVYGYQINY